MIGSYRIELFGNPKLRDLQLLTVSRDGQILVTMRDYCLAIDPPKPWDDTWAPPPFGVSITGDDVPELVVYAWCRAAYVLPMLHVYELGSELRTIYEFEEFVFGFRKIGQDPDWKIVAGDLSWTGWWNAFFGNKVIVGFDPQTRRYRFDTSFMRKPTPTEADLRAVAEEVRADDRWSFNSGSPKMTATLIELIYSGNGAYADKLLDLAWNPKDPDKAEYRSEVMECDLRDSSWWLDVAKFNGWSALESDCHVFPK